MICLEGVVKRFAPRRRWLDVLKPRPADGIALNGVTLSVGDGEIVGLLGPNGAGKTTLLKILSTLVIPDAGRVEIAGVDILEQPARARGLLSPVAADERSLEWRLSARENLRFYGALHGLRGNALNARIEEVLGAVELDTAVTRMVGGFSSGMRQRLLIARGLLPRPRVLLLDEPTRSLDPLAARAFRDLVRHELAGRQGCTVLLATHDPDEALDLCDRVAIMDRGRIVALGTPAQLAHEFAEQRYRLWMRPVGRSIQQALATSDLCVRRITELDTEEWVVLELDLTPSADGVVEVLARLVQQGLPIGRFEKVQPTVADLMARATSRQEHVVA